MPQQQKQIVMITGASKGLGRALTLAFARRGAGLAVCARGGEALRKVKEKAEAYGTEVLAISADISQTRDMERFVTLAQSAYGSIDVLINNASILGPSPMPYLIDYPEEDFEEVLRVNTLGPFLITRRVMSGMLQRGKGSIINVTSEAGSSAYAGWGAYGVSKFALEGLSQTWSAEVEGSGVRVNLVDPGEMETQMHALAVPDCDYELAAPEKLTDIFLYLASEQAAAINGQRFEAQKWKGVFKNEP